MRAIPHEGLGEPLPPPDSRRTSNESHLLGLVAAHVSLGIAGYSFAHSSIPRELEWKYLPTVPLFPLALCQASLLGLWAATSRSSAWTRVAGAVVGAAYLEFLFTTDWMAEFLGLSTMTLALTSACLLVLRRLGLRVGRRIDWASLTPSKPEGLKFSIQGLMLFITAVAVLSAAARALKSILDPLLLIMVLLALCFVVVGFVALWACLAEAHPLHRSPVVLAVSLMLGAFFAYAFSVSWWDGWIYIMLIMGVEAVALLGSLLVVRSCGYRLDWRAEPLVALSVGVRFKGSTELGQQAGEFTSSES